MMLALGAMLVIMGEMTPGVMIAGSILLGRALAPIDQAVGHWPTLQRALAAWRSLSALLGEVPPDSLRTKLPAPRAILETEGLMVAAPGARVAAVRGAALRLDRGRRRGLRDDPLRANHLRPCARRGVAADSGLGAPGWGGTRTIRWGFGKICRLSAAGSGSVRWDRSRRTYPFLGRYERRGHRRRGEAHRGARDATRTPGGYDFQVSAGGAALSGGQRKRIALAREFYGSPVVVVMDEPDSNLDAEGTMALARRWKARKNAAARRLSWRIATARLPSATRCT